MHSVVEIRRRVGGAKRPCGGVVLAGREDAPANAVQALAEPFHPLPAQSVVGSRTRLSVGDDAGTGPVVVVDAIAREPIVTIVEDDTAHGCHVARLAIDLGPVGDQARVAAGDFHVARGHDQIVRSELLYAVCHDRDLPLRRRDRDRGLPEGGLAPGQYGQPDQQDYDEDARRHETARSTGHGMSPKRCCKASATRYSEPATTVTAVGRCAARASADTTEGAMSPCGRSAGS